MIDDQSICSSMVFIEKNIKITRSFLAKSIDIPYALKVLLAPTIIEVILGFLQPGDAIEFLICHPYSIENSLPWNMINEWLELNCLDEQIKAKFDHPRKLAIHAVKKLGYNCTNCYKALDGRADRGIFASASLCTKCSTKKFQTEKTPFVDGIIRFYLSGDDSITLKGRAFTEHPFWISSDDVHEKVKSQFGSAFQLAVNIYEEKTFFKTFAPEINRPRDDKPDTIRKMLDVESDKRNSKSKVTGIRNIAASMFCPLKLLSTPSNSTCSAGSAKALEIDHCNGSVGDNVQYPINEPNWYPHLPKTLKPIYQEQLVRKREGKSKPNLLGTLPLRDLVKSMHERDKSESIKTL